MSDELTKLLHPLFGDVADVGGLLGVWMLVIAASVVVPNLGGEVAVEMAGGGTAGCVFAVRCSKQ